jgi:hypothetical protein
MSSIDNLLQEAYKQYGSNLGFKPVYVGEKRRYGIHEIRLTNFYFFLKDEPYRGEDSWSEYYKNIKNGKIHHAVVKSNGIYDYTNNKSYDTLENWYIDVRESVMGEKESYPPLETVLQFGRTSRSDVSFILNYNQFLEKLKELLNCDFYKPSEDSWDILIPKGKIRVTQKRLSFYYKHPETGYLMQAYILRKVYGWKPGDPRYICRWFTTDPTKPIVEDGSRVSDIHPNLKLSDVYFLQQRNYAKVLLPLSEICST